MNRRFIWNSNLNIPRPKLWEKEAGGMRRTGLGPGLSLGLGGGSGTTVPEQDEKLRNDEAAIPVVGEDLEEKEKEKQQ